MHVLIMNDYSCYGQECEDYVRREFFPAKSFPFHGNHGVTTVTFDDKEELLWAGNQKGIVSSFYGVNSDISASFPAHNLSEIRHLVTHDEQIFALTHDSISCSSKPGQLLYRYKSPSLTNLQCALFSPPNCLYLGGLQSDIIEFDFEASKELRKVEICNNIGNVILRFSNSFLCSGSSDGKVSLLDPCSLSLVHSLEAHSGSLSDFDVCGNQLVTCGFSLRNDHHMIDRHLMIFDLRYFKAMTPMKILIDPMFVRFVQIYSKQICVVSQTGQFQVLEQGSAGFQSLIYDVPMSGGHLTSCAVSASNHVLAFGESTGYLHTFFANHESLVFNHFLADAQFIAEDHQFTLSAYDGQLPTDVTYYTDAVPASVWTPQEGGDRLDQPLYHNPVEGGFAFYHSAMHQHDIGAFYEGVNSTEDGGAFGAVQSELKSNVSTIATGLSKQTDPSPPLLIPKFYRKVEIKYSKYGVDGFDFRSYNRSSFSGLETHIPNAYCNAMIQVLYFVEPLRNTLMSHLCEREFCLSCELDFLFHMLQRGTTQTCQATNFLRAFRTIPQVSALGLALSESDETFGGLVDLSRLIQSWNRFILQQIDSELSSQTSLGLESELLSSLNFGSDKLDHCPIIKASDDNIYAGIGDQSIGCCFNESGGNLKRSFPDDTILPSPAEKWTIVKQLFGYDVALVLSCRVCGESVERKTSLLIVDLIYPKLSGQSKETRKVPFAKIVVNSLNNEHKMRSWCSSCKKYQVHYQHKTINSLPDILSLHCQLESPSDFSFWKSQEQNCPKLNGDLAAPAAKLCHFGSACARADCRFRHEKPRNYPSANSEDACRSSWVPFDLKLSRNPDGKVQTVNADTEADENSDVEHYELIASVACIREGKTGGKDHLVSHVMAGKSQVGLSKHRGAASGQWFLFNDFAISPIDRNLAVNFDLEWKIPCILYFAKRDVNQNYNIEVCNPITSDVLFSSLSLVSPQISDITFVPLELSELPQEGDIVGLDAEFVKLNPETSEMNIDGTKSTIKPSQMSVARVTCIREKGPLSGVPFIDDYICTHEQVVDYLTEFSGIQPGDLDPALSSKYLTTLKSTYLKLQHLINAKVVFVGHGLKKDFRVLNLVVPPEQVVDTVELFHLPKRRMISLKFLAWYFLGLKIQSQIHDSIEDSRAAIDLYYKYQELSADGPESLNMQLEKLYETGQMLNWHIDEQQLSVADLNLDSSLP